MFLKKQNPKVPKTDRDVPRNAISNFPASLTGARIRWHVNPLEAASRPAFINDVIGSAWAL